MAEINKPKRRPLGLRVGSTMRLITTTEYSDFPPRTRCIVVSREFIKEKFAEDIKDTTALINEDGNKWGYRYRGELWINEYDVDYLKSE